MTLKEMELTLKSNGVETEDIETLVAYYKKEHPSLVFLDQMLTDMGYEKIFTDEIFGWDDEDEDGYDDAFSYSQKNHHKPQWVD